MFTLHSTFSVVPVEALQFGSQLCDSQHSARVCLSRVNQLEHHVIAVNDKGVKNVYKMGIDASSWNRMRVNFLSFLPAFNEAKWG